ncbi:ESF1 homolog isoform X2 [Halictus rubicundus]|uniref:ESF1 homolog isoform X2 n=1 Tax=Halictus rubicundus TaxID=77578 RepID=UPI004036E193
MDALSSDARFAHIAKDPKFKRIPKAERKVKIDKRFQGMFKDKRFAVKYTIDKRGRPVSQTSSENLKKYYDLSSSEEEEDNDVEDEGEEKEMRKKTVTPKSKHKTNQEKSKKKKNQNKLEDLSYVKNNLDDKDEDKHSDSSDNDFSSNGELLKIKSQEHTEDSEQHTESENESESESDEGSVSNVDSLKTDLKESKKQLHTKRGNESNKLPDKIKEKLKDLSINYARGEGVLMTDSSSDDDDDDNEEVSDEEIEHNWGELDKEADTTDEITHRLAVCNMDWDRIRAVDLIVLFNSFLPSGGIIRSVTIYPSEFGLQRMKEEEITGPKELIEMSNKEDIDNENEDEEGSTYQMEKLRQYQLNRLKYYYAVVVFDSPETANKIYTECDGTEYESTATKLDLRFIPDDTEFDQTPKEVCDEVPELSKYQPRQFTTTALQQVNVQLTWDETNPERMEIAQKLNSGKLDDINERDLHAYLATDSSDDEADTEKKEKLQEDKEDSDLETNTDSVEKYKALLKEIEEKEEAKQKKEVELEFSWGLGTKQKAEKLVQVKMKKDENLTPFEQYLEKRKAKKKTKQEERKKRKDTDKDASTNSEESDLVASESDEEITNKKSRGKKKAVKNGDVSENDDNEEKRKAELELLLMDEDQNDDKRHFNMKKIEELATMTKSKQKRLSKKKNGQPIQEDNFEVNVQDPRFNALFTSHHYNIDPADPHYRKTKGTEALIKEKLKRRADSDPIDESESKHQKKKPNSDLQVLIKTVKRNAKNIARPIK